MKYNELRNRTHAAGCSRRAAAHHAGCALGLLLLAGLPTGCGEDDRQANVLPPVLDLNGSAAITLPDGRSAVCELFLHVELEDDGERDGEWRVYRATSGGDAIRMVTEEDGSGFAFWPHLHSGATVRVSADSIEIEADGRDETVERFYREIMLLRGGRSGDGVAVGNWDCAPLDLDSGGYLDTAIVAQGSWILTEGAND